VRWFALAYRIAADRPQATRAIAAAAVALGVSHPISFVFLTIMAQFAGNEQQLIHRISGIEGHVRSLKKLIAEGREPNEILMQIASIRAAMKRLSHVLFEEYVEATLTGIDSADSRGTAIADIRAALETLL
jgi:CsoR family transcriptional regulator, copper-sensing transcriptional repressor